MGDFKAAVHNPGPTTFVARDALSDACRRGTLD